MFFSEIKRKSFLSVGILLALSFSNAILGYARGYTEMYRPYTNTTLDVIYDVHINEIGVTTDEILNQPLSTLKHRLYPTEARIVDGLDKLNWLAPDKSIDLVWEGRPDTIPLDPVFLGCKNQVKDTFTRLNFIYGDSYRRDFEDSWSWNTHGIRSSMTGPSSFESPVPLSFEMISKIITHSGEQAWAGFKRYYDEKIAAIKNYYRPWYQTDTFMYSQTHFRDNYLYHSIADLEFLSHILASDKKKIVLYAGGWHCDNIVEFLKANGFGVIEEFVYPLGNAREIPVYALEGLDRDALSIPAPSVPAQPINPVSPVISKPPVPVKPVRAKPATPAPAVKRPTAPVAPVKGKPVRSVAPKTMKPAISRPKTVKPAVSRPKTVKPAVSRLKPVVKPRTMKPAVVRTKPIVKPKVVAGKRPIAPVAAKKPVQRTVGRPAKKPAPRTKGPQRRPTAPRPISKRSAKVS